MNKAELIANLNARTVKIIGEPTISNLNGGDKEYSYNTVIKTPEGFEEENYSIRVIDEGLETEVADYVRKSPPVLLSREAMLKQRLLYLKTQGELVFCDLTHLGVPFATFKIDGAKKVAVDLDGELIIEPIE